MSPRIKTVLLVAGLSYGLLSTVLIASMATAACGTRWGVVHGQSMVPALKDGQRILIRQVPASLEKGDIVTFHPPGYPDQNFVQRIVALPGERVETGADWTVVVPKEQYFIMGDNRNNSYDSRSFGPVPKRAIWGKVIWP